MEALTVGGLGMADVTPPQVKRRVDEAMAMIAHYIGVMDKDLRSEPRTGDEDVVELIDNIAGRLRKERESKIRSRGNP